MFTKLTKDQLESKINFLKNYVSADNAATGSLVDPNANVSSHNIATLNGELMKDIFIQVNRSLLKDQITYNYGGDLAKQFDADIKDHIIYVNDETSNNPYCVSVSLYPFLTDGLTTLGGESKAPKHIDSFCGSFVNLIFAISSQFAGAVAAVEFLCYFDYFCRKDYGEDYHKELYKEDSEVCSKVKNHLQHIVYALNQPAAARNYQSVFFNISVYDENYFNSLFDGFVFPDFTKPKWESIDVLQEFFLSWFNKERETALLTFPVVTAAMLTEGNKPKDEKFARMLSKQLAEGNSFFMYMSDSADSLASCCFDENQEILVKSSSNGVERISFKDFENKKWKEKRNFKIFHDGCWVTGKLVKVDKKGRKMFKVKTSNNKVAVMTEDHLNPTLNGDVRADALTTKDYLMFNSTTAQAVKENDLGLTYEDGLLIGAYLGDGSIYQNNRCDSVTTTLSLNKDKIQLLENILNGWNISESKNNVVFAKTNRKDIEAYIRKYVSGGYANTKRLNLDVITQSVEFRKGILEGFYITDGGNSNRIYTTSEGLTKDLETVITSLGMQCIINVSDRTDEKVVIRGEEFDRNYPLYCIRFYSETNRRSSKDVFIKRLGNTFFKITEIEEVDYDNDYVYCFEMGDKEEPYFTLPHGMVTHNCRLRNGISDNTFSFTLGAGGVATGSTKVITINVNRLVQKGYDIEEVADRVRKYLVSHRKLLEWYESQGMLPVYDAGYISLKKQYLTLGINGLVEAAEFKGIPPKPTQEYKEFVDSILKPLYYGNKEAAEQTGYMFNTEFVPAENLGVKNAKWDRDDNLVVPRDCYNSYFYAVEDEESHVFEKMMLHGADYVQYLDGGSALHLNLAEFMDEDKFYGLLCVAATAGVNYWCTNIVSTVCEDCGYINKNTLRYCSECGSSNVSGASRVIGYLKKFTDYSKDRKLEASKRHYHTGD